MCTHFQTEPPANAEAQSDLQVEENFRNKVYILYQKKENYFDFYGWKADTVNYFQVWKKNLRSWSKENW